MARLVTCQEVGRLCARVRLCACAFGILNSVKFDRGQGFPAGSLAYDYFRTTDSYFKVVLAVQSGKTRDEIQREFGR